MTTNRKFIHFIYYIWFFVKGACSFYNILTLHQDTSQDAYDSAIGEIVNSK